MKAWLKTRWLHYKQWLDRETVGFCMLGMFVLSGGFLAVLAAKEGFSVSDTPVEVAAQTTTQVTGTTMPVHIEAETTTTTTSYLYESIPVDSFTVTNLVRNVNSALDYTQWFYAQHDECRYLCLPSTADRTALQITYTATGGQLYLNNTPVISGATTDLLSTADEFTVRVGSTDYGTLKVLQSDIGAIFLSTSTGGLDYVDAKKTNEDSGTALMVNADGNVEYLGEFEKIGARGNSSWDYSKKKPYNLKLPQKSDLFGMGKAKKWALVSNYLDHPMIRNSIAMALSEGAGLDFTMDYVYVDLYADGDYRGTYQLFERVQIQKQRVNITDLEEATEQANSTMDISEAKFISSTGELKTCEKGSYRYCDIPNDPADITGGYLLEFQTYNRYTSQIHTCGFVTTRGQCVQLKDPEYATEAQVLYARQFVQELEDAIYSETGYNALGKHYSEYVDVDSLVKAYLVQEITANADGSYTSFYFWKESDTKGDGKLRAGPVWDFDLAFANFGRAVNGHACGNANSFYTIYLPIHRNYVGEDAEEQTLGWLGTLFAKEEYYEQVVSCYYEVFAPVVATLCDDVSPDSIYAMGQYLSKSAAMNNAKWDMLGKNKPLGPVNGYTYEECVAYVRNFVAKKTTFLAGAFLETGKAQLQASLQAAYDALPFDRYDAEALETLGTILADGTAAIEAAATYEEAKQSCDQAISDLQAVCTVYCFGDFNNDGKVTTIDVVRMLQHYAIVIGDGSHQPTAQQLQNCDTNGDGVIDTIDAIDVLTYIALHIGE
ncbi:MAG: CotH kinase family protein [Oscillospiraceae bacterium]|nr:CotH kinase family protein [Oscillospiraceae bacterium]